LTSKHPAEGRAVTGSHLHITSEPDIERWEIF